MRTQPQFDTHQFAGRERRAVSVKYIGHETESTNIAFSDYQRMHTEYRKPFAGRRLPSPPWAMNDEQLRAVVTRCVERRAYMNRVDKKHPKGTDSERLAQAKQVLAARKQNQIGTLDCLLDIHRTLKEKCGDNPAAVRLAAQKVEEHDTLLITNEKPELFLLGVAYRYWRVGENSVEVGAALGIRPPLVRKLCWRMRFAAGELGYEPPQTKRRTRRNRIAIDRVCTQRGRCIRHLPKRADTCLIPSDERLPLVIKLRKRGATKNEIRRALGWATNSNDGYGMVKRLMVQAGLR